MNEPLKDWIALASVARSYRRKFDLARYIHSRSQRPAVAAAAARVVESLAEVIDRPIADPVRLKRARDAFNDLHWMMRVQVKLDILVMTGPFIGPPRAPASRKPFATGCRFRSAVQR